MTAPNEQILTDKVSLITCNQCGQNVDVSAFDSFAEISCPHCQTTQTVPAQLAHFLLVKELGSGGMGKVYHAYDPNLSRFVAIKVMQAELGEDAQFVETFRREAQAAAGLNHPNIVQIYSFGTEKGQPYIVMEYLPGKRFNEQIDEDGMLPLDQICKVGIDIANGLNAASSAGLLHGDVKPDNILLDERNNAKLVDFGLASSIDKQQSSGIWGTPYYIAPEKAARQRVDSRSDMYSLGATLYHAAAGVPPFDGDDPIEVVKARLTEMPTPLSELRTGIDAAVAAAIERMLATDAGRRHPTYASLIADLEKAAQAVAANSTGRSSRPKGRVQIKKRAGTPVHSSKGKAKVVVSASRRTVRTKASGGKDAGEAGDEVADAPERKPAAQKAAPKKKSKTGMWVALTVVAILVGGGLFYAKTLSDADKIARFKLKKRGEEAIGNAQAHLQHTHDAYANTVALHVGATNAMSEIDVAARRLFAPEDHQRLSAHAKVILSSLETITGGAEEVPEEEAPEDAAEAEAPAEEAAAAPKPKAPSAPRRDAAGRDMPVGLNPLVFGSDAPILEPDPEPVAVAPRSADDVPGAPAVRPERIPPLRELVDQNRAQGLYTNSAASYGQVLESVAQAGWATNSLRRLHEDMGAKNTQLQGAGDTPTAQALWNQVLTFVPEVDGALADFEMAVSNGTDRLMVLSSQRDAFLRIRDGATKRQADMRTQRAASVAARQAFIKAYRAKQAYKKQVQQELLSVDQMHTSKKQLYLKGNHFRPAANEFIRARRTLKTTEGKEALQVVLDRYEALQDLKLFIIKNINAKTCEWCWKGQVDVVSANDVGIKIKTRQAIIKWEDVDTGHMLRLIKHSLDPSNKDLLRQDRARMTMAAGIYCYEHDALPAAQTFRDRAVGVWDRGAFKVEIDRLLPNQGGDSFDTF